VALQGRPAIGEHVVAEAGHDHHLVEPDRLQVADRDVEDRAIPVDLQQRLGQLVRERRKATAPAGGEHHADHAASSSSSSYTAGAPTRRDDVQLEPDSPTSATAMTPAATYSPPGSRSAASRTQVSAIRPSQPSESAAVHTGG